MSVSGWRVSIPFVTIGTLLAGPLITSDAVESEGDWTPNATATSEGSNITIETSSVEILSTFTGDQSITFTGILTKPKGSDRFPAVVLLHGCGGPRKGRDGFWAKQLARSGYVTLRVDSLSPRRWDNLCDGTGVSERTRDAYDAKSFLEKQDYVSEDQIAVMGWSHGGIIVHYAMTATGYRGEKISDITESFPVGISFYPYCGYSLRDLNGPLLHLHGAEDDWVSAYKCAEAMPHEEETNHEIKLLIYPEAYHGFDEPDLDTVYEYDGDKHRLLYNPAAGQDSVQQVEAFLARHLKGEAYEFQSEAGTQAEELASKLIRLLRR